ncbi:DUF58 domain-containing protein [Halioxenophilus aromaticivorans]|uniref:DUF58 domain-containing protein n=1 Tax=Halioxenophilus aromaticivorans TaxID=1306992 RepID=A0AAV3TXK4_9ALTE
MASLTALSPSAHNSNQHLPQGVYANLDNLLRTRFTASKLNLKFPRPSKALLSGPIRTRFKGRGMEFEEVRVYQPGDDIRTIDWRVTARTQVTHTKLFQEEREKPVLLVVDQRSTMFFGSQQCFKSVYAAHLATTLGWAALHQNDRIGALIFGDNEQKDLRPRRSKHAQLNLIHEIIAFNHALTSPVAQQQAQSLQELLTDALRVAKPGTKVFILSDFHDFSEDCEKSLHLLARHNDVALFQIYDQLERSWPQASQLYVSNGKEQMRVDGKAKDFHKRYEQQFQQRRTALQNCANRLAISLIDACVQHDPDRLLTSLFGKTKDRSKASRL